MKGRSERTPAGARARPGKRRGRSASPAEPAAEPASRPAPSAAGGAALTEHIQALRRYANVLVGSHADADDLVQEALKRALTYLEDGRQIENLRAYLFTILHNVRNDMLKKRARGGTQVPVEDTTLVSGQASQADRIACSQVIQAMQQLSEEHRQILLLVGVEGMSYRDAAEILDLPIGTVMSRLSRGRAALREVLGLEGPVEIDRAF